MKTTSRKRLLISSVAMLLVAMLALGTATFAWFTSSTTATAKGINVKTIQSSELVISKSDKQWGTQVDYGTANKVLQPVSTATGENWFTANAAVKGNFARPEGTDFEPIANANSYYFAEQLNVANKGAADVTGAEITFTFPANNYARVAVVEADVNGKILSDADFKECVYDNAGVAYDAAATAKTTASITPKTTYKVNVGDLAGKADGEEMGQAKYYNIYVWFEGQDAQCIDANAGQAIPDVEFSVTGKTADQG